MNKLDLIDKRSILLESSQSMVDTAKKEMRKLNDSERKTFETNISAIKGIDAEIEKAETEMRKDVKIVNINTKKQMDKRFNLLTAIRNRAEGRSMTDEDAAVIDAGKAEMRKSGVTAEGDITLPLEYRTSITAAGSATEGIEVVAEDKFNILAPLRNALVTVKAGATFLTGLVGDLSIPTYAGTTAAWKGEIVTAVDGAGAFGEVNLKPRKITAFIDVSKQFLAQDSSSAEAMLKTDIVNAVAAALEGAIFGTADGSGVPCQGFFNVAPTTSTGAVTWKKVIALETAVDTGNALMDNLKYITNATGRGYLKGAVKGTSGIMLLEGTELNGYPILATNHIPNNLQSGTNEAGIIFGNWNDLIIGQWGGIDVLVDPYTQAALGMVRIVVNAYVDAKPRRAASFTTGSMLVSA